MRFYENWGIIKRLLVCLGGYGALGFLLIADGMTRMGLAGLAAPFFLANSLFFYRAFLVPLREMDRQFLHFNQGYDLESIFNRKIYFTPADRKSVV